MKILVVSDTHKDTAELERLLARYADEVKIVCHMGDHASDLMKFQAQYPQLGMVAVGGNCDFINAQREIILSFTECADRPDAWETKILLVHGHTQSVKRGIDKLAYYAAEKGVQAAFFGHTHCPEATTRGGVFIFNPGSPAYPRGGSQKSYGIVEISPDGQVSGTVFTI